MSSRKNKTSSWIVFIIAWATLVYLPICHWVREDTHELGALDFAGGTVVHTNCGHPH